MGFITEAQSWKKRKSLGVIVVQDDTLVVFKKVQHVNLLIRKHLFRFKSNLVLMKLLLVQSFDVCIHLKP